jgi:hypothetical protein
MDSLIHSFELFIPASSEDMQQLFSKYRIRVNKYRYIRAAVKELNKELKNVFPAYAIVRTWEDKHLDGIWYLQFKVDAVKVLNRGTITEEDYELIELDIRKFLSYHFGYSYHYDYHTLTRIDYRIDVEVPNPNTESCYSTYWRNAQLSLHTKRKLNGVRMKMVIHKSTIHPNITNVRVRN